jgi:hypothetical protein
MPKTRDNHYVPEWYQKGFLSGKSNQLHYLDITPDTKRLPDGLIITMNCRSIRPTSKCFYQTDLYTTFFGGYINDEIERILFGQIDSTGAKAVRAFIGADMVEWHNHFPNFFSYIDSQKIRTPKGLDWIKIHYPNLNQIDLMLEMQAVRNMHCTLWTEGVREIVSAKNSDVKFIISDHPVTVYNYACDPTSKQCLYPDDPSIAQKGTQTIFPLNNDHCLILTNLEYAKNPNNQDPTEKRTNARFVRQSMVRTDAFIRTRNLNENEISTINLILKRRARRYIAAQKEEWLYPEKRISSGWSDMKEVLLPPENELYHFGGELYAGFKDGGTYYQDAFGRTMPENKYLIKTNKKNKIGSNDPCGCGSGKKYKKCCMNKKEEDRTTWDVLSIRERNLVLYNGVQNILGFNKGKNWDDVRRELSNEQIIKIHKLYGSLWPIDTDIFSLLPKPDNTLRALYTGMIDPRMTTLFALGAVPYFDEVLIQHPFINPGAIKPEFSPVDSPHQHKHQMLKNLLLFLYLQPFIESGVINFIPDPCFFDQHLHRQMLDMAEQRRSGMKMNKHEADRYMKLCEDDFSRTIRLLPKEHRISQIRKAMPELSAEQIEELLQYMEKMNQKDPLSLLQDSALSEGGQLMMMSMTPNFEMSLFIAQATGSIILTDSETRWEELKAAQYKENGIVSHPWSDLSNFLNNLKYYFSADPEKNFIHRMNGNFGSLRKVFREIYSTIQNNQNVQDAILIERLKKEVKISLETAVRSYDTNKQFTFDVKMNFLMPKGGFTDNNVQRLLLKSGSEKHLSNAPMVIFVEPCNTDKL